MGGGGWVFLIFLLPFAFLGGIIALIIWLIQRSRRPSADTASVPSSDRGQRDRAAGKTLTIQIVAKRSLAAGDRGERGCVEAIVRVRLARSLKALVGELRFPL